MSLQCSPASVGLAYPCFKAYNAKFMQKAWFILSRDACRSLHHDHSPEITDVIDELAHCLALKEAPRDHSNGSCVKLPKC